MHILALIFLIYVIVKWLRGGYRAHQVQPQRVDIHVFVHHPGDGGEAAEEPLLLTRRVDHNVVPFRHGR